MRNPAFARPAICTLALGTCFATAAPAATVQWITDGNGTWSTTSNWSSSPLLPGLSDDVVINRPSGDWLITVGAGSQSVNSLSSEERLRIVGTLSVQTTATINNTLTLAGGTLTGGVWTFAPGRLVIGAAGGLLESVTINGDVPVSNPLTGVTFGAGLNLNGTARVTGAGSFIGVSGSRTIGSGTVAFESATSGERGAIEALTSGTALTLGAGAVIRGGHGDIGGTFVNETALSAFTNEGLVSADRAGTTLGIKAGTFTNNAIAEATSGGVLDIAPTAAFTNTGTLRASSGGTLRLARGAGMAWSNTGTLEIDGGAIEVSGNFATADFPSVTGTGGALKLTGTLQNTGSTFVAPASVSLTLRGGSVIGGTVGTTVRCETGSGNLLDGVEILGDLDMTPVSSRVTVSNGLRLSGVATMGNTSTIVSNQTQTFESGTIRFGTTATISSISHTQGSLTLAPGTLVEAYNGAYGRIYHEFNGLSSVVSKGTLRATGAGSRLTLSTRSFTNEGVIESLSGAEINIGVTSPEVGSTWKNYGVLRANNATLALSGSFTFEPGSSIERVGTGVIRLQGDLDNTGRTIDFNSSTGSWTAAGGSIIGGTVNLSDGQGFILPGGPSLSRVTYDSTTINGDMPLSGNGIMSFRNNVTVNGEVYFPSNKTKFETYGDTTLNGGTFRFGQNLGNEFSALTIDSFGSLVLSSTTTVRGGTAVINHGPLTNHGTIWADLPGKRLAVEATSFLNDGTLKATNGGLLSVYVPSNIVPLGGDFVADGGRIDLRGNIALAPTATWSSTNDGSIYLLGSIQNTGRVLNIDSPSKSLNLEGTSGWSPHIVGGTVNISGGGKLSIARTTSTSSYGSLRDVTVNGDLDIDENDVLAVIDSANFNGTVRMRTQMELLATGTSVSLGGSGTIHAKNTDDPLDTSKQYIKIPPSATTTIGSDLTIKGGSLDSFMSPAATLGWAYGANQPSTLINQGTLISEGQNRVFGVTANYFENQGLMEARSGSYMLIKPNGTTWSNVGTIRADAATAVLIGSPPSSDPSGRGQTVLNYGTLEAVNGGRIWIRPLVIPNTLGARGSALTSYTNQGTLFIDGESTGTVDGDYTQGASGTSIFELGASSAATPRLTITGNASLAGAAEIRLDAGFEPQWGDSFRLVEAAGDLAGAFTSWSLPTLNPLLRWWNEVSGDSVLAGVRHYADFNHDGAVNTIDLTVMLGQFGSVGSGYVADIDRDGAVTTIDLTQFLGGFGLSASSFNLSVPAPSGVALVSVAMLGSLRRRRARRSSAPCRGEPRR